MKKYLKAFILFPLIIQIIGTVALTFSNNDTDQIQSSVLSVFIVAAVPTFLITLWAAFHRYASYNVKAIALPDERWDKVDIKTTNLIPNILAQTKAEKKFAYTAMLFRDGICTEGATSNVFAVKDGQLSVN